MTGDAVDRRPARTTAILAAVVAAVVVGLVGWATGFGRATTLAVLGSALLAAGAWGIEEPTRTRQAGGSIAATAGAALLFGLFVLTADGRGGWLLFALAVGLAFVAVDAAVGFERNRVRGLTSVLVENGKALIVGVFVTTVGYLVVASGVLQALFGGIFAVSRSTALAGLVSLQVYLLCAALAIPRAASLLEWWVADDGDADDPALNSVESAGLRVGDVPTVYWVALAVQFAVALSPRANLLFDHFFGWILGPVLTSGVLHGLVGLVLVALLLVFVATAVRWWIIAWFGAVPAQTFAVQAGGISSILVAVLVSLVLHYLPDSRVVDVVAPLVADGYSIGLPAVGLTVLGVGVVVTIVLFGLGSTLAGRGFAPERATGFAIGSALLFAATLGAATAGAPAVVVFVGVAGALLTWDLGSHASSVGSQLGQAGVTRRSEFVHVTGSCLVLGAAVAVATLASYVVVPATAPAGTQETSGLAALSMILVLVALLAFVAAVHLRGRASET